MSQRQLHWGDKKAVNYCYLGIEFTGNCSWDSHAHAEWRETLALQRFSGKEDILLFAEYYTHVAVAVLMQLTTHSQTQAEL